MSEFEKYLSIVAKWWWLLVLTTLLGAGAGLGITVSTPPEYRASASVLVRTGGSTDDYSAVMASEKMALTYENLMTKRPVIEQAARALGLEPDPIARQLDVHLVSRTLVIELGVTDRDPQRAANIANAVLAAFVKTQQESGNARARDIAVVEVASPPSKPASPNVARNLVLTSAGGLLLGAGIVLAFELLNDKLDGMADVRHKLSIPVLAVVPRPAFLGTASSFRQGLRRRVRARAAGQGSSLLSTLLSSPYGLSSSNGGESPAGKGLPEQHPHASKMARRKPCEVFATPVSPDPDREENLVDGQAVEAYRTLRTWLQFSYGRASLRDRCLPSLVITSPRSRRDNGSVAINLGAALALADLQVILVDADLREPSLQRFVENAAAERTIESGLSDLLARGGNWQKHVVATRIPNLSLLPAGSPAADPLRLFSSPEMAHLLRQLRKRADVVLLNTPPVLNAADTLILAAQVDATLLVIENRMPFKWAAQALAMLQSGQANVLGAILTQARLRASEPPPHRDFGQWLESAESMPRYSGAQPQVIHWIPAGKPTWRIAGEASSDGLPDPSQRMPAEATLRALVPGQIVTDVLLRADPNPTQKDHGNTRVPITAGEREPLRQGDR